MQHHCSVLSGWCDSTCVCWLVIEHTSAWFTSEFQVKHKLWNRFIALAFTAIQTVLKILNILLVIAVVVNIWYIGFICQSAAYKSFDRLFSVVNLGVLAVLIGFMISSHCVVNIFFKMCLLCWKPYLSLCRAKNKIRGRKWTVKSQPTLNAEVYVFDRVESGGGD